MQLCSLAAISSKILSAARIECIVVEKCAYLCCVFILPRFREGSDTEILFRQISSVWYMANLDLYNCALLILVTPDGSLNTTALVERQTRSQDIFNGFLPPMEELAAGFAVDHAAYIDELPFLLDSFLSSNHMSAPTVFTDNEDKLESMAAGVPMNIDGSSASAGIDLARCVKDDTELELLRYASGVAAASHMAAWAATVGNNGISELSLEATFVEASQTCGLRFQAYIPIVAGRAFYLAELNCVN